MAHAITIDINESKPLDQYRWRCSCERAGDWTPKAHSARTGGARHVAAMERGAAKAPRTKRRPTGTWRWR